MTIIIQNIFVLLLLLVITLILILFLFIKLIGKLILYRNNKNNLRHTIEKNI